MMFDYMLLYCLLTYYMYVMVYGMEWIGMDGGMEGWRDGGMEGGREVGR